MHGNRTLAALTAAALTLQTAPASAQPACITEDEVSAMAIYSVPSVVRSVRLTCDARLAPSGFLARRGDAFANRYAALQTAVWPRAKSGAIKALSGKAGDASQSLAMVSDLPESAIRPLVDALIVQEVAARIEGGSCARIELAMEGLAVLDPEVAGTMLGVIVGLVGSDDPPVCRGGGA